MVIATENKTETYQKLLIAAEAALKNCYAPYSGYEVGAAVMSEDGRIFSACNVECASWEGSICAERAVIVKAISEGCSKFQAIAVFCKKTMATWPCGVCRQFLREFGLQLVVVSRAEDGSILAKTMDDLLPCSFGPSHVMGN